MASAKHATVKNPFRLRSLDSRGATKATAAIAAAQTTLKDAVRELSPIVMNTFAKDAGKLAAWKSASRVERAPKKKKAPTPPPPPPPVK